MRLVLFLLGCLFVQSCTTKITYDLVITNAEVFDTKQGIVYSNKSILINADTIAEIVDAGSPVKARKIIDAKGKLVTPGIIDAHIHPTHFFGDYDAAPEYLAEDSLNFLRKKFSDNYLPYGVTAVMIMGQPETWLKPVLNWSANPSPGYTDVYTVGGALISKEDRKPYICHISVESPDAARQKVIDYYKAGIRHIKLYWRLRRPEFEAAYKTADSLGMRIYGHIDDWVMTMDTTLKIGLRNYEHLFTVVHNLAFTKQEDKKFVLWLENIYGKDKWKDIPYFEMVLNELRWCVDFTPTKLDSLVERLAKNNATFSTTIHLFGEKFGMTYFSNPGNMPDSTLSNERKKQNADNFKVLMALAKKMHVKGIKIRIGTDCPNGGKAALSEQLLLAQYGFSIPSVIQISTINGATALGMENKYGSVEKGKKADLIIYDQNPFDNYRNFISGKIIIKDGKVYNHPATQ